jgi:hypothetical protein
MFSLLTTIDIYGIPFNFTIGNAPKYQTKFGGVLTLMTIALLVLITLVFGQDFFNQNTPRILSDTRFPEPNSIQYNFTEENFPIYFQFLDEYTYEILDLRDKLYYNFVYTKLTRNDNQSLSMDKWYDQRTFPVNSTLCSDNKKIKNRGGIDTSVYQCLKYPDNGTWLLADNIVVYPVINMQFSLCDVSRQNCKNATELKEFLSSRKIILSVAMMSAKFFPWNKDQPLKDTVLFKYFTMNYNLHRSDAYSMNFVNLDDDQGWLSKSIKSIKSFELASSDYSYMFVKDEYMMQNPIFYEVAFQINYSYTSKTRYYMKLQEVLAVVMGFLNIFRSIFFIICTIINPMLMRDQFINEMFQHRELSP